MNSKLFFILLTAVFLCFSNVSAVSAATITVSTLTDENNTNAAACSLREAINNANNDNGSGLGCTAGSGTDNIVFSISGTITPSFPLPSITTSMNITGGGASSLTISGNNFRRVFNITDGTVSINNLTVANGYDAAQAGGIYHGGTALTLSGVVVTNSSSPQGGGLQNDTTMTIVNSTISNNSSDGYAAGMLNVGTMTISGSTVSGNQSVNEGGGIANTGSLTVSDSTFANNSAGLGNAISQNGTSLSVTRSTFTGNLTGSAIYIDTSGASNISNSTFFNNLETAVESYSAFTLTNCTITGNRSDSGAIAVGGGSATLVNNIVAGNTNSAGTSQSDIQLYGGSVNTAASFNNLIGTGGAGGLTNGTNGNQTSVPLANVRLLPLGNYGGAVQTMPIRTNSPARNAGRNTGAPTTDARGYSRPQGVTDIGAFEIQTNSVVTNTANSGTGSLRDTVAAVPANEIVQFETPLFYSSAQTISLSGGQIAIGKNLTIYGTGANLLNVRNTAAASGTSRVFLINSGFTVSLTGMTVSGGNITGTSGGASGGDGGGIYNDGGNLTLNGVVVDGNAATYRAGGIGGANGSLTILNSAVINSVLNTTVNGGAGGVYTVNQTVVLSNSTFSGNRVTGGISFNVGGVALVGPANNSTVTSCTIANNSTDGNNSTGGLSNGNGTTTVRNSIIASNVNNAVSRDISGSFVSAGYNLIGNRGTSTDFTQPTDQTGTSELFENADGKNLAPAAVLDPKLLTLSNNGGTVPTHALNGASPAIDKGNSFGLTTDARGVTRPVDLSNFPNAAGGDGADIGAFEAQLAPTAAGTSISGRVMLNNGSGLVNATIYLTDQQGNSRSARTSSFGNYQFEDVAAGQTYVIVVVSKRYQFAPQVLSVSDNITDLNFIAIE